MSNDIYMDNLYALYEKENLSMFILGHLGLESLLDQLVIRGLKEPKVYDDLSLRFAQKNKLVQGMGYYNTEFSRFVGRINTIRNNFSHRLEFDITFEDAFQLINMAHNVGIDFSDDNIWRNRDNSEKWYGVEGILQEVIANNNIHVSNLVVEAGGTVY